MRLLEDRHDEGYDAEQDEHHLVLSVLVGEPMVGPLTGQNAVSITIGNHLDEDKFLNLVLSRETWERLVREVAEELGRV